MKNNLTCKNSTAALATLEAIALNMPRGTQRNALVAVHDWMLNNLPPDFSEETVKRIQSIYEETEGQKKGRAWIEKEMEDPAYVGRYGDHHEFIHEPEDGAELECVYKAKYKAWIPEGFGWPDVLHRTDEAPEGEGES